MSLIEWNDGFTIGVQQFDEHHKHLVGLLNRSYNEFVQDAPVEVCSELLDELFDYASYHFVSEEFWMAKHSYPQAGPHIDEHNYFINRLIEIRQDYKTGKASTPLKIFTFLTDWLSRHILKSDAEYGRFISSEHLSTIL